MTFSRSTDLVLQIDGDEVQEFEALVEIGLIYAPLGADLRDFIVRLLGRLTEDSEGGALPRPRSTPWPSRPGRRPSMPSTSSPASAARPSGRSISRPRWRPAGTPRMS